MKKIIWLSLGLLLVVSALLITGCDTITPPSRPATSASSYGPGGQQSGIWVSGQGEVSVTPDLAVLQLGVEAQEATVAAAQAAATGAMNSVMSALTGSGVKSEDIKTRYFRVQQRTRWDEQTGQEVVTGYRVSNSVIAKIRDIENVGDIIDAAVRAGGDFIRIDDLSFTVDDPSVYYDEAREIATADARDKAEKLARQNDVKLGDPTYISENAYIPAVYESMMFAASGAPVPAPVPVTPSISPGEVKVTLTVQVAYAIE